MRIGTKSLLDCRSSRLVSGLFTPWALVHHYLTLGCSDSTWTNSVTQHFPLCTNCFRWDLFYTLWSFMYIYICLCRSYDEKKIAMKYKTSSTSSLHWYGAWGDTFGGKLALRAALAGGRRQPPMVMVVMMKMKMMMMMMMMLTADGCSAFESTALSPFSISCLTAKLARLEVNWLPKMKDISYR